ncbi:MAG TPA: hypothetical protein VJV79_25305 [Polyangiaceae bacterium]|nr:hypothetical protein [Polyangiaceae bacterium]
MTASDRDDYSTDERFERLLLDSGQSDQLPSNVDAAWDKFGAALNGASLLAAGAGGALAVQRAQRWLAVKWLIGGALAGSALTALSLRPSQDRPIVPSAASVPSAIAPVTSSVAAAERASEGQPPAAALPPMAKLLPRSNRPRTPLARAEAAPSPEPPLSSTLSAQVALLDAARSALASGAFAEALRLADRYRSDFASGELAPEAEVVAIEALVQGGQRQPALERATRFVARYPGDPHTARVKWLVR